MQTTTETHKLVTDFIEEVWNHNHVEKLDTYLHPDFTDHSLPPSLPADKDGLLQWIAQTNQSFEHHSRIEELVAEHDTAIAKIRMNSTHTSIWRDIEPTGITASIVGYRTFKIADGKIKEHWALFDGNALENQLRHASQGCKIQE